MSFQYTKADFEQMATAFDVCAWLNDCSKCRAHVRCLKRWDIVSGKTEPYGNLNDRICAKTGRAEPNYDTSFISSVLKEYYPGLF